MPSWILVCPNCGTENTTKRADLRAECGIIHCACTCVNCEQDFEGQQEYWRWLGLEEGPAEASAGARAPRV